MSTSTAVLFFGAALTTVMMFQTAGASLTPADETVPKGHKVASMEGSVVEGNGLEYLRARHQKTILLKKAHDNSDRPLLWGPFNVHVYNNAEVGSDPEICGNHQSAQCKSGRVCVRLQPVGTRKWLSHSQYQSKMTTKEEQEHQHRKGGRGLGCGVVMEAETTSSGRHGVNIVDFEFIDWWTGDYGDESHVGMDKSGQVMTENGYSVRDDFMWTFVDIPDPTEEPTDVPTPAPTAMTEVPTPENETGHNVTMAPLTPTAPTPTTDSESKSSSGLSTGAVVGIAVGGAIVVLALIALATVVMTKRRSRGGTKVSRTGTITEANASEQMLTIVTAEEEQQEQQQQVVEAEPVAVAEEEEENVDEL